MNTYKLFFKYVLLNIAGMLGISLYVLADTFFISRSVGTDGITALNLCLPIYSFIFAIGAMLGVGGAIRFSIASAQGTKDKDIYFVNSILVGTIIGLVFSFFGLFCPGKILAVMGADAAITAVGKSYTRIFVSMAPFFIWNHICNAFVRNDNNPKVAMCATLISSLFNIVFDYIFMFPLKMGMSGAALATALSPLVGVGICFFHFLSGKNTISFKLIRPSLKSTLFCSKVGVSAFVSEISSGVITTVFNIIILSLAGNTGVAAYGIVANLAIVATSIFNGIAMGVQPLISDFYGRGDLHNMKKMRNLAFLLSLLCAALVIGASYCFTDGIIGIFNSEKNEELYTIAFKGMRLYFFGFIPAGINVVCATFFSSSNRPQWAFVQSVVKGFIAIIFCAVIMSRLWNMTGVWLAFTAAEIITFAISFTGIFYSKETGKG